MTSVLLLLACLLSSSLVGCVPEATVDNAKQNPSPLNGWHDRRRRLLNGSRTGEATPAEVWDSFMKSGRVLSRGEREAKFVDYDGNRES